MKKEIPIMFCFDNNYVIPAGVAFYSLLKHCNKNYNYVLYVLHTDITDENQKKLIDNIEEFSEFSKLEFINMEHRFQDLWDKISTKGHFSKEVMYKVLVASLFPQYEKIVVSDVDVVFLNDISESYTSFDVNEDYYLAGIRMIGKYNWYLNIYKENFTDEEIEKLSGFCGGYIIFNLKKIREDNLEDAFIKCFEENGDRINQMEQDILNLCCYPKTKLLPLKYLACSYMWDEYKTDKDKETDGFYSKKEIEDAMENTVQLHYATSKKPWKCVDSTKSDVWFKYLSETIFLNDYLKILPDMIVLSEDRINVIKESAIKEFNIKNNNSSNTKIKSRLEKYKVYWYLRYIIKNPLFMFKSDFYNKIKKKLEKYKIYWYVRYVIKNPLFIFKPSFYKKLLLKLKKKIIKEELIIFDDTFPSDYSPFRYEEYSSYMKEFPNSKVFTTGKVLKFFNKNLRIKNVINNFLYNNKEYKNRIIINNKNYEYKLNNFNKPIAIMTFLQNAYDNLRLLEKYQIPFIFTLYPGGGFILNNEESDNKLKKIFESTYFRKVIVTQYNIKDYLLKNNLVTAEKIEYIFGVVTPKKMLKQKVKEKKYFGDGRDQLNICFVAHKYTKDGRDKGFDIFKDVCEKLLKENYKIGFHIVGSYNKDDIDNNDIKEKINFHGILSTNKLKRLYKDMDIIISPTRPFILNKGSFDGFPTASSTEAMLNKVLLITTDVLNLNQDNFINDSEIIIVAPDKNQIAEKVIMLYNDPKLLKEISEKGYKKAKKIYSYKNQIGRRIKIIKKVYKEVEENYGK